MEGDPLDDLNLSYPMPEEKSRRANVSLRDIWWAIIYGISAIYDSLSTSTTSVDDAIISERTAFAELKNKTMSGEFNTFSNIPGSAINSIIAVDFIPSSEGGLGGLDAGKLAKFSGTGGLTASGSLRVRPVGSSTEIRLYHSDNTTYHRLSPPTGATSTYIISFPNTGGTMLLEANAATVTNKVIDGASNTLTVRAGSDITGTLPIANGGTGTDTPGLQSGTAISVTGSWPNQIVGVQFNPVIEGNLTANYLRIIEQEGAGIKRLSIRYPGSLIDDQQIILDIGDGSQSRNLTLRANVFFEALGSGGGGEPDGEIIFRSGTNSDVTFPSGSFVVARQADLPLAAPSFVTLTDGATVTITCNFLKVVQNSSVTLGGNRTLSISGVSNGMKGVLIVKQDATGGRTLTLPAGSLVVNGGAGVVTLSSAANAIDVLNWSYDGTNFLWNYGVNFS